MIMLCATPARLRDMIFVTTSSYKPQTGSKPRVACVPASPPLVTRDLSSLEPSRAGRASSGTVLPSAIGQVPAARPSSLKPALSQPSCVKTLCHFSPLYPHPCLFCPSPALFLVLTQLSKQLLAPWCLPGRTSLEEWCEVGMVCICYFYSLFRGSICRDLGPLPDVRTALGDPGRSQGPVPRPQHLPPPSPRNFCPSPFPMWKPAKINAHILTAALWAGSDPSSATESTSSVPSSSLGHFAAAGSHHLHHPHPWGHLEP